MNKSDGITVIIDAIRELTDVGICYYDLKSFFGYDKNGEKNNMGHYCAFCNKARSTSVGWQACQKSDRINAIVLAEQYKEPFFFECHMGMRELVIPLFREDVLLGILFVGQCRIDDNYENVICANAKKFGFLPQELLELYNQLPLISQKELINIGKILTQYFDTKIFNAEVLSGNNSSVMSRDLAKSIRNYIMLNYRYNISLKDIANTFFVNPSYASRCFSERYNETISEYICRVRMEQAKVLLVSTEATVGNIALNVGYSDVNYFSRVFKKYEGCSPVEYRSNKKQ